MKSKFFSGVSSKIIAWATVLATIVAIVTAMAMFDDRYARAEDSKETHEEIIESIKLMNINMKINGLQSQRIMLKMNKRDLMLKQAENPEDPTIRCLLEDANEDMATINRRIGDLENEQLR